MLPLAQQDIKLIKVLTFEAVAQLPLMGFLQIEELKKCVVWRRAEWLSLEHPMS